MKKPVQANQTSQKTIWIVVTCLFIGFFIGVVVGVYRSGTISESAGTGNQKAESTQLKAQIENLKAATQKNPDDLDAWIRLGNAYFDSDLYEPSIQAYQKALAIDSKNANVWTDLGVMYRLSKKPQEAIKAFDRAAEADPKHDVSRINKGIVLLHDLNDRDSAIQAWESALEINPMATFSSGQSLDEVLTQLKKQEKPI
jgi:tetratricopeptide (TPR) repeat protein